MVSATGSFATAPPTTWPSGGQFSLPIFVFNVGLDARYTRSLSPYVHVGGFLDLNFIQGFSGFEGLAVLSYGGGPIVSLGPSWANVTLSLPVYGLYNDFSQGRAEHLWAFMPSVSIGVRVHRYAGLLLEFHFLMGGDRDGLWLGGDDGVFFLLNYGLRLHGERFFGDVGFVMPFAGDEFFVLDVFPMGFPMLNSASTCESAKRVSCPRDPSDGLPRATLRVQSVTRGFLS